MKNFKIPYPRLWAVFAIVGLLNFAASTAYKKAPSVFEAGWEIEVGNKPAYIAHEITNYLEINDWAGFKLNPAYKRQAQYIVDHLPAAIESRLQHDTPISLKLAQGVLESGNGTSKLSKLHNNHFGIKCFKKNCPKGHCVNYHDDDAKDMFRKYSTAVESYLAHDIFLKGPRYKAAWKYEPWEYEKWSKEIYEAGYATGKNYDKKLNVIVERYDLSMFDKLSKAELRHLQWYLIDLRNG